MFPLSSFCFGLDRKIGFHPNVSLVDPGDTAGLQPYPARPPLLTQVPYVRLSWLAETLGTGAIPGELFAILTACFRAVCKYGAALPSDKRFFRVIRSFVAQLVPGVALIPGLDRVTLLGVDPEGMVHLFHSLFSVLFDLYSNI